MTAPTRTALSALSGSSPAARKWNAALHPRGQHGQFRTVLSRVVVDLAQWINAGAPQHTDPLAAYSQPQLRSVAVSLGLNPPTGTRHSTLKAMLKAHAQNLGGPASASAPAPAAPQPVKVSRAVSGIAGVTATQLPVQGGNPGSPAWMNATQSLDIHLNGTRIGTVHQYGFGWVADSPAGNRVGASAGNKTGAIRALVAHHHAAGLTQTTVAGVTLRRAPQVFGNAPDHVEVDLNGVDIGDVHGDLSGSGPWMAYPPTTAAWGLQSTPGSGQAYPSKDAAIQGLVGAYGQHLAAPAPLTVGGLATALPNGVTANRWATPFSGFDTTYSLYYGGVQIGAIHEHQATGAWIVYTTGPKKQLNPEYNEHDAAEAVLDEYKANPWSSPTKLAPVATRIQEAINRHVTEGGGPNDANDPLAGFTHRQLVDVARKNNIPRGATVSRRQLSASLVQALGPKPVAPAAPARPSAPVDPVVKAAQDVLYGADPKAKTAVRQLQAYGALRRSHFDSLSADERNTLLGDLSYIATTAKGANATRAQKLIDRFTPPGTAPGHMPTPPAQIVGPATGTQTRLPTPQPGLLAQAKNSGTRGDAWVSGSAGPAVWGEYGSGGLLLRHVDAQGVERFLLTQRGPGISDPGMWSYPGGAFESREDFYQGATREVAEELGWNDADFAGAQVHGYHVFERPDVKAKDGTTGATRPWTYHSVAADVPTQLVPNLRTSGARAETSDARWMTRAEIDQLDRQGKLHGPVAGGKLQQNVMSLFPAQVTTARPGPRTTRPARLAGTPSTPAMVQAHKPSRGTDLISDQAAKDKLRQDVKAARVRYAGKTADDRLAAIGAMQGYDDTPTVVSKAEIDRLLATGDYIEVWRGVKGAGGSYRSGRGGAVSQTKTAAQIQEEMRSGPAWYGTGMYGNGYYFATDRQVAVGYGDGTRGSVVRALIPKKAKTERHSKIEAGAHAASSATSRAKGKSHEEGTLYDEGRYAAALGIDAIEIPYSSSSSHVTRPGKPAFNVVNRSILIVEEA